MKKVLVYFIIVSLICLSISGAVSSIKIQNNGNIDESIEINNPIGTSEKANRIASIANRYLNVGENHFTPVTISSQNKLVLPWVTSAKTDLFEWWINVRYDGVEDSQKIVIPPDEFKEFLKNPLYMREYYFNVDPDSEDDVQVKIGFYKNTVLNMEESKDVSGLATKTIIRTWFPDGTGIDDTSKDLLVWSEIRLNYGLFKKDTPKSTPTYKTPLSKLKENLNLPSNGLFSKIIEKLLLLRQNRIFTPILNLLNRIQQRLQDANDKDTPSNGDIIPLANDDDWVSIGMGYHSTEGNRIPQVVEKHFSFAKENIFNPSIFQHEMFPGGTDPYQLEFGFRACTADTTDPENAVTDISFGVQFEPAVYMRTQFIPKDGYVYYHFGQDSQSSHTKVTFLADIVKGSGESVPLLSLLFDRIDNELGHSGSWISFDLNTKGFGYKASHEFDVGIDVGVPDKFTEKVKIKGLPTSVDFEWGVDNTDFIIIPGVTFIAGLSVYTQLTMSSNIDEIIVYYPRTTAMSSDTPDSPFLVVNNIPRSQRITVGGSIGIDSSDILDVSVSGSFDMDMSSSIGKIDVYYPKADWDNDPDLLFITAPGGLPGEIEADAIVTLNVDLGNILNPNNYIYAKTSHNFNDKIDEISVLLPDPEFEDPIVSFTEIPAYGELRGQVYWAKLQGYMYSFRSSEGRPPDPITINFEYDLDGDGENDFKIYNFLKIRDGHIHTSFNIANQGNFYFDTSNRMLEDDFRFYNYRTGDSLLISVDEVSADQLQADWDIDTSGDQIQINKLKFGGIIDTLKGFDLSLDYKGKIGSLDLDWVIGESGSFEIELNQDDNIILDFDDLFPNPSDSYVLDGSITLSNQFDFDMQWKLDLGQNAQNPGYIKINKNNDHANIQAFDLYFTLKDSSGKETYGIDVYFLNPRIYLDLQWYFDVDDIIPPYVYWWLDVDFIADSKDVKLLWTDLQGNTDWIEVI